MAGNSFGRLFRLHTFGESHGPAIGGVLDGCPAGIKINTGDIQEELDRRRPGQSAITTQRAEDDTIEILSGVFEGVSTGTPIGFIIRNKDQKSADYDQLANAYRPSHADFTYEKKYGLRDHRGGGRSSARETACRVAAGAIARSVISTADITVSAFVRQVGDVATEQTHDTLLLSDTYKSIVRCPDPVAAEKMRQLIEKVREKGDTVGGIIQCVINGAPAGLGEPVFDKLHAMLAHAMLSINAVKGFEIGSGFAGALRLGSEENDIFESDAEGRIRTRTNHSGGIQGGISNGMPIVMNIAFKPVSTLMRPQQTVNSQGTTVSVHPKGRHDPCVLPRAVPVVEAMAAMVMADFLLMGRTSRI